jgi:hypothetical protein
LLRRKICLPSLGEWGNCEDCGGLLQYIGTPDEPLYCGGCAWKHEPEMAYLKGYEEMACQIVNALGEQSDPRLRALGAAFWNEIVGCGDIVPFEFRDCWRRALDATQDWKEP